MLEVRSAYGYYGSAGGATGENPPRPSIRIPYRVYKKSYCNNDTVYGSYDPTDKTIEVYFTEAEMKKMTNLGNTYQLQTYDFVLGNYPLYGDNHRETVVYQFYAKNKGNAERNAKALCKKYEYTFIREATKEDLKSYKYIWGR